VKGYYLSSLEKGFIQSPELEDLDVYFEGCNEDGIWRDDASFLLSKIKR
jgi:hypothetical protein